MVGRAGLGAKVGRPGGLQSAMYDICMYSYYNMYTVYIEFVFCLIIPNVIWMQNQPTCHIIS